MRGNTYWSTSEDRAERNNRLYAINQVMHIYTKLTGFLRQSVRSLLIKRDFKNPIDLERYIQ